MNAKGRRFRAEVDGRTIELVVNDDHVTIDTQTLPYSCVRLTESHLSLIVGERSTSALVLRDSGHRYRVHIRGREIVVDLRDEKDLLQERFARVAEGQAGILEIRAPMPGLVLSVSALPGAHVAAGEGLVVLEAMKMENELRAPAAGAVRAIHVAPGDAVGKNDLLMEIEA